MFKGIEIKYGLRMNDSLLMNVPLVFFFHELLQLTTKTWHRNVFIEGKKPFKFIASHTVILSFITMKFW